MSDQPEVDSWKPPLSYDIGSDGKAYGVAVLANPDHSQGEWVKLTDYRELERQRDALEAWKKSAMEVESRWDCQAVAKLLEMKPGCDVRSGIEPGIRAIISQRDAYAETLREVAKLSIWISDIPLADTIRERHPELENVQTLAPAPESP